MRPKPGVILAAEVRRRDEPIVCEQTEDLLNLGGRPDLDRPYRAFGYPVVPALYIALCAVIALGLLVVKPVFSWPSFLIVLTGIPVYLLWRRRPESC